MQNRHPKLRFLHRNACFICKGGLNNFPTRVGAMERIITGVVLLKSVDSSDFVIVTLQKL